MPRRAAGVLASAVGALALGLAFAVQAQSGPSVWIASGREGGTYYDVYGRNLISYLREFRLIRKKTSGSGENLDLLAKGGAHLGFAQADIFAARARDDSARYGDVLVVGRLAKECVYIAHRVDGPVVDLSGLQAPVNGSPPRIAVGPPESGAAGTWGYMATLLPGLGTAEALDETGTLALNRLAAGAFDAVAWVTDPGNLDHLLLQSVRANEKLALMPVTDPVFEHALPDGTVVYEREKVKTKTGMFGTSVETICTAALLLARKDTDERLLTRVSDLLSLHRKEIVGRAPPSI